MTWSSPPSTCMLRFSPLKLALYCEAMLGCKHSWLLQRLCTCTMPACADFNVGRLIMACADGTMWMYAACRSWDS